MNGYHDQKEGSGTEDKSEPMDLYFLPAEESAAEMRAEGVQKGVKPKVPNLGELAAHIREQAEKSGVKTWEVSVEGYLEVGTGFWPGGKAGFKATLTVSNK